jgi:hypothetical protein
LIRFRAFQEQSGKRSRKLVQDIRIRWNSTYLMLRRAYQLREFVDLWTEEYCEDSKIAKIKLNESEWFMVLLVGNLLNPFYECTLVVSRTTNSGIHLGFRIFDALFNHLEQIEKDIRRSTCPSSAVIVKACEKASNKLAKYYVKTEGSGGTIYNLANILNPTMKLGLYKTWDDKDNQDREHDEEPVHYETKYKTEFKEYFRRYYEDSAVNLRAEAQRARSDADEVMHFFLSWRKWLRIFFHAQYPQ